MDSLLIILVVIFSGVALMVVLGDRFAKPADPEKMQKLQRWIIPLVGLSLVLSLARHYWPG